MTSNNEGIKEQRERGGGGSEAQSPHSRVTEAPDLTTRRPKHATAQHRRAEQRGGKKWKEVILYIILFI
jgi:hypothetical protein